MKSNRIASIIIESNRIVRSVNRSGPSLKSRDIFPKSPKITTPLSCSKQ